MTAKIGLFPASGHLASSITTHLFNLVPPSQFILVARHPDKLAEATRAGATVRRGDYDDPSTLERVFDGVGVLMLVSYPSIEVERRFEAHKNAITAARRSGVKHIFYSSLAFAGDLTSSSVAHVMGAHLATENYLAGLPGRFTYTAIREGIYSESFPMYTGWFDLKNNPPSEQQDYEDEDIKIPHDGTGPGIAWAKRDELGEATAKLVVSYAKNPEAFPYLNKVVLLSGPDEVSLRETVNVLGRVAGRPLRIREVGVDEYVALSVNEKTKYSGMAREWATVWEAIRRGETAVVTGVLKEVLGREPERFEGTVRGIFQSS